MTIDQFQGLGVSFSSNWAIVSQCGNYGVSGQSAPNMITPMGGKRDSALTFTFTQQVSVAGIFCGCPTPVTITLVCYNQFNLTVGTSHCPTSTTLSLCQVQASAIQYCVLTAPPTATCDNLTGLSQLFRDFVSSFSQVVLSRDFASIPRFRF